MVYQYVAYSESGELVKGKLSAANEEAATQMLGYAGYRPVSLKPYVSFLSAFSSPELLYKVKPVEIKLFYRQLAMLLESGNNITTSLELLQQQADNPLLRKILGEVVADVRTGTQLSVTLLKHPKIFVPVYCRLLAVGEQSGGLEGVLRQVADYMEKQATTAQETKGALLYPIITLGLTVVVIGLLVLFVLPNFAKLYVTMGVPLPTMMKIMMTVSDMVLKYAMQLFLAAVAIGGAFLLYLKTPGGRYNFDKMMLRIPRVGRVTHLGELARCCRSMGLLFRSGLPLTEVMPLVIQSTGNRALIRALNDVQQDMVRGEGLSKPMGKNKLFLPMMVQMVRVGEETGNLDVTLQTVAQSYEADAEQKMRSLIALIQPVMTIFMGGVIAVVAVTLMTAMTSMYGQAK